MPLYLRILLLFLLNVALLFGSLAWAAHRQMQSGLDSFLGAVVGANLQEAAEKMNATLGETPGSEWPDLIDRYEKQHGVQVGLFREPVDHLAGSLKDVPPEVIISLFRGLGGNMRRPGPGPQGPPPGAFGPPGNSSSETAGPRRGPAGLPGASKDFPRALIRAGEPLRYWAITSMPPIRSGERGPPSRLTFAIVTDSVLTCPLLFDAKPWLAAFAAALLLSSLLWLPFVRGITRKLREVKQATRRMASGQLDVRIRENRSDEIGEVAASVNQMAAQLEGYVGGQRRFMQDIAHELCSPISRLQAAAGVLGTDPPRERQRQYVEALDSELQHMSHLVNELLQFAKATQPREHRMEAVVLDPLIQTVIDRECGPEGEHAIEVDVPNDLIVAAEPTLLARAIGNVLRNALRYAAGSGKIGIAALKEDDGHVRLSISDSGPGVPAETLSRLFEPFYRTDDARTPGHGGIGLGLAIVKHCIQSCGGTVTAENRNPSGFIVTMHLHPSPHQSA